MSQIISSYIMIPPRLHKNKFVACFEPVCSGLAWSIRILVLTPSLTLCDVTGTNGGHRHLGSLFSVQCMYVWRTMQGTSQSKGNLSGAHEQTLCPHHVLARTLQYMSGT